MKRICLVCLHLSMVFLVVTGTVNAQIAKKTERRTKNNSSSLDVSDYNRYFYGKNYTKADFTLYNPLTYLILPGEYSYHVLLKALFLQRHIAGDWHKVSSNLPVFDTVSTVSDYGTMSKNSSLCQDNDQPDTLLMACSRHYHYTTDTTMHWVTEVQQDELLQLPAVASATGHADTLYSNFRQLRTYHFYNNQHHLTGLLTQWLQLPFDERQARYNPFKRIVRSDIPGGNLQIVYRKDSILLFPAYDHVSEEGRMPDHIYSADANGAIMPDSYDYNYYSGMWKKLMRNAPNYAAYTAGNQAENSYAYSMIIRYDSAAQQYHAGYYYRNALTKDMVLDSRMQPVYTVTVFDNTIDLRARNNGNSYALGKITGGLAIIYRDYTDKEPVQITLSNYRFTTSYYNPDRIINSRPEEMKADTSTEPVANSSLETLLTACKPGAANEKLLRALYAKVKALPGSFLSGSFDKAVLRQADLSEPLQQALLIKQNPYSNSYTGLLISNGYYQKKKLICKQQSGISHLFYRQNKSSILWQ